MKIVRVIYTTKPELAEKNKANIKAVMEDLQQLNPAGIFYHVCLGADGKTFTHTAFFESDEDRKILNELPSFRRFQEELKSGIPEISPQQEMLTLVGSSRRIFNG
jgi:hypothetical protein